jgi:mono/diheme cytochrome c family protein
MKALLVLSCLALAACAPQSAPLPDAALAARSGTSQATLQRGHAVYLAHCSRCHEAVRPADVSREDWHVVVPGMSWNAGISEADEQALAAYILAATR